MYVIRHISPIICTFGHFGANIGLWRLIWWPVGCGAWLLLRQSFYFIYVCSEWVKLCIVFWKITQLHSFLSRSFWKNRLWFQCRLWVFRRVWCYIEYMLNTSPHNTGIIRFSNDNHLLYLLMGTTVCKRKFWSLTHTYIYQRSHHVKPSNAWSPRTLLTFSCWEKWRSHTKFHAGPLKEIEFFTRSFFFFTFLPNQISTFLQLLSYLHQILLKQLLLELRNYGAFVFVFAFKFDLYLFLFLYWSRIGICGGQSSISLEYQTQPPPILTRLIL